MGGKTHQSCGVLSFALLAGPLSQTVHLFPSVPLPGLIVGVAVGAVSGLLPDMDEPNAMLGRGSWMPKAFGAPLRALAWFLSIPFRLMGYVLKGTLGHRGGTHSLAMSLIMTLAFAIPITSFFGGSADWVIWAIWFGFLSHLAADMLNPSGVPLFWPLLSKHKTYHLLPKAIRIPTTTPATWREMQIRRITFVAAFVLLILYYAAEPAARIFGILN